jgi:hypothetical protein
MARLSYFKEPEHLYTFIQSTRVSYTLLDPLLYVVISKEGNTLVNYRLSHEAHSECNHVAQRQSTANYFKERWKDDVKDLGVFHVHC